MSLTASFGNGDVFLWMLEFFLLVIWFWLLISIFSDLFRDHELSGWAKAFWVIFVVALPYLGVLVYLIVRGRGMADRTARQAQAAQKQYNAQIRAAAGTSATPADQIVQAKSLLDSGAIDQAEFDKLKAAVVAS